MRNQLYKKYQQVLDKKKLADGGFASAVGGGATLANGVIDATQTNTGGGVDGNYGYASVGASVGKYAATGAAAGASFGPWGAAIGGVVGAAGGLVKGELDKGKIRNLRGKAIMQSRINENNYSQATLAQDPSHEFGNTNADYFKNGGRIRVMGDGGDLPSQQQSNPAWIKMNTDSDSNPNLTRNPISQLITTGGNAKTLSSDNTLIKGRSHAQGGIQIPELGSEVEGGETTKGNYVFSKNLGFAQQHLPIAKAIGIIEKKPQTKERVNSLKRLRDREQDLIQQQEQVKQINGLS